MPITKSNTHTGYNSIDLLKFIMAFAVVAIHTHPLHHCTNTILNVVYSNFVSMAVPFFFLACGYLLSRKMVYPFVETDIYIVKNQFTKILKIYILWMILYTPLAVYHNICEGTSFLHSSLLYVRNLFFVGEQYNSWHLWYLLSTSYSLLLIMLLIKRKIAPKCLLLISCLFLIIKNGTDWLSTTATELPIVLQFLQRIVRYSVVNGRIFTGMIYIPLGMYLAHNQFPLRNHVIAFVVGAISRCLIDSQNLDSVLLSITMFGFWGIIENLKLPNNAVYLIFRKLSTGIYLIHMYIWSIYYMIVYKEKTYGMDSFFATSIISLLLSLVVLFPKENRRTA